MPPSQAVVFPAIGNISRRRLAVIEVGGTGAANRIGEAGTEMSSLSLHTGTLRRYIT